MLPIRYRRRKGPNKLPSRKLLEELYGYTLLLVQRGDPSEFALRPSPLGQYGKTVSRALRALLVERGTLDSVVELAMRGLKHHNPRVRYECTHALDWLGDDRCVPALLDVLHDPVPRVRWIALHALSCDECKLEPLQPRAEVVQATVGMAAHDLNPRVRGAASSMLAQRPQPAEDAR